ncbi:hypothetical protein NL676_037672 [Syzygium grande]|nr:hypothetical protein NL676_037672 [Syzygium grande]
MGRTATRRSISTWSGLSLLGAVQNSDQGPHRNSDLRKEKRFVLRRWMLFHACNLVKTLRFASKRGQMAAIGKRESVEGLITRAPYDNDQVAVLIIEMKSLKLTTTLGKVHRTSERVELLGPARTRPHDMCRDVDVAATPRSKRKKQEREEATKRRRSRSSSRRHHHPPHETRSLKRTVMMTVQRRRHEIFLLAWTFPEKAPEKSKKAKEPPPPFPTPSPAPQESLGVARAT